MQPNNFFTVLVLLGASFGCTGTTGVSNRPDTSDAGVTEHLDAAVGTDAEAHGEPDVWSTDDAAGTPGANPSDAGSEADAPVVVDSAVGGFGCDSVPGALVCDDFESGEIEAATWERETRGDVRIEVSEERSYEGRYSVRFTLPAAAGPQASLVNTDIFPVRDNAYFGRAFVYIENRLPANHAMLIRTRRAGDRDERAEYRLDSNAGRLNSRFTSPAVNDVVHGGYKKFGFEPPIGEWFCLEWHHDGAANSMRYWFDSVEEETMRVDGTEDPPWTAPTFDRFGFGYNNYQTSGEPLSIYYDAVALSETRVGCGSL